MDGWTEASPEFAHLRQIPTTLVDSFVQTHGRVHPKVPAKSMPRARTLHERSRDYLMCRNDDFDAPEYIVPYPLFCPELDVVGS